MFTTIYTLVVISTYYNRPADIEITEVNSYKTCRYIEEFIQQIPSKNGVRYMTTCVKDLKELK